MQTQRLCLGPKGMVCSQGHRNEDRLTSYFLQACSKQDSFFFFSVGTCKIQCLNICTCFSEVFFMYTTWPFRQGNVTETRLMGCDSAGVFLGKCWEIHLSPALVQPNRLVVKAILKTHQKAWFCGLHFFWLF